jgi:DNA modification methylase
MTQEIDQYRNKILQGDCLVVLKTLPSNSIQMCVTSPPYFNLRSYNVEGQIGHEETPEQFVKKIVEVFEEVKRVLRKDGVCFLNMGDTYWGSNGFSRATTDFQRKGRNNAPSNDRTLSKNTNLKTKDLCLVPQRLEIALQDAGWYIRNNIIWYKRNPMPFPVTDRFINSHEIIIYMTKSAKCFFDVYAVKEPTVKDPDKQESHPFGKKGGKLETLNNRLLSGTEWTNTGLRNKRDVWDVTVKGTKEIHFATFPQDLIEPCILAGTSERGACATCGAPYKRVVEKGEPLQEWKDKCGADSKGEYNGVSEKFLKQDALGKATQTGFNARWKEKQQNASDVKRRILEGMVGTKTVDWEPTCACYNNKQKGVDIGQSPQSFIRDDKIDVLRAKSREDAVKMYPNDPEKQKEYIKYVHDHGCSDPATQGKAVAWSTSCACDASESRPCIVLDPFMGSGTTAIVAQKFGRDYIGIELNPEYIVMAERRIKTAKEELDKAKSKNKTLEAF